MPLCVAVRYLNTGKRYSLVVTGHGKSRKVAAPLTRVLTTRCGTVQIRDPNDTRTCRSGTNPPAHNVIEGVVSGIREQISYYWNSLVTHSVAIRRERGSSIMTARLGSAE